MIQRNSESTFRLLGENVFYKRLIAQYPGIVTPTMKLFPVPFIQFRQDKALKVFLRGAQRFSKLTQNPLGCQSWNCLQSKEGSMAAPGIVSRILHQSGTYRVEMNRANQFQEIALGVN